MCQYRCISRIKFFVFAWILLILSGGTFAASDKGLLWKIEKAGAGVTSPVYLFGTIHSDDPRVFELFSEEVESHFEEADSLTLEMLLDEETKMTVAAALFLTDGQNLLELIGEEAFFKTVKVLSGHGMLFPIAMRLKPWAAAVMLNVPPSKSGRRLDLELYRMGQEQDKALYGLESPAEQIGVFDALSQEEQINMLKEALDTAEEIPDRYETIHKLYLAGDLEGMVKFNETLTQQAEDQALARSLSRRLLDDRNLRMVKRMQARLEEGDAFIAIGAMHLPGPKGVLALLRKRGYRVSVVH